MSARRLHSGMSDRWLYAWALAAVAFGGASLTVPLYVVELGGDAFVLGILFATASFVGVPGALVFGRLADRTGRRRVFVLGAMAATATTAVAIPAVDSIPLVVVFNAVLWLGFAAATPVLTLLVVAGAPEREWTDRIARLNKLQGIGWAAGLLVGFLVVAAGSTVLAVVDAQRLFFLVCAACSGVGFAVATRELPADPAPGREPSPRRLRRRVREADRFTVRGAAFPFTPGRIDVRRLRPRRFVARFTPDLAIYFGAVLLVFTGFGVFFAPLPAYLGDVGYDSSGVFALYLLLNVGAAVAFGWAGRLARRYEVTVLQAVALLGRGLAFPTVVLLGAGGVVGSLTLGAVFVLVGITWAVIAVTAATLVSRLSPPAIRGEALGVYGALVALAGGLGGLFGGTLAASGYVVAFGAAGALVGVGALVVALLGRRTAAGTAAREGAVGAGSGP